MSPLPVIASALTAGAAFLWFDAFSGLWPARPVPAAATSATVIGFLCWQRVGSRCREDRERRRENAYLDTIENLTRPAAPARKGPTGPFRRVRQ